MSSLYGLVVCGGKSSRMGTDKSMLNYHGQPQRYHLYEMLQPLCERVFLSVNSAQNYDIPSVYEVLVDDPGYDNIGPMGALLTAFKHYPEVDFLVVGCDYPHIQHEHLQQLLKVKHESMHTAAYYNSLVNIYEPLLSVYQSNILYLLNHYFNQKIYSLQKLLCEVNATIIVPDNDIAIMSIDIFDEYKKTINQLHNNEKDNVI